MPKKKNKRGRERFIATAKRQLARCCVPTCVAIVASVTISKLGGAALPIALIAGAVIAYRKGYRLKICRSGDKPTDDTDQ